MQPSSFAQVVLSRCSYSDHTSSHNVITSEKKYQITNTGPTSLSNNSQYNSPDPYMSLYPSDHSSYQPNYISINEERERNREDTRNLSDYIYCPPTLHSDVSKQQRLEEENRRLIDEEEEAERKRLTQKADEALENVDRHRMKKRQTTTIFSPPIQQQRRPSDAKINSYDLIIDEDEMAEETRRRSRRPETDEVLFDDEDSSLPFDPNLVCPKCGRQYRVGEIQKMKRHMVEFCTGKR